MGLLHGTPDVWGMMNAAETGIAPTLTLTLTLNLTLNLLP